MVNNCILNFLKRLKNDGSVTGLFRNSDPESNDEIPPLGPVVKSEVESDNAENAASNNTNDSEASRVNFVQIKNREVFDYEPNANSIHASLWPHWWLKAVQSRHKLRKAEAKKNMRFKAGLQHLLKEALEVGTINYLFFQV